MHFLQWEIMLLLLEGLFLYDQPFKHLVNSGTQNGKHKGLEVCQEEAFVANIQVMPNCGRRTGR